MKVGRVVLYTFWLGRIVTGHELEKQPANPSVDCAFGRVETPEIHPYCLVLRPRLRRSSIPAGDTFGIGIRTFGCCSALQNDVKPALTRNRRTRVASS